MQGIPVATLSSYRSPSEVARLGRGWGHASADALDKVDPKHLKDAAMVLTQPLVHLANEEDAIAERTPVEEIVRHLGETGMAETLRAQLSGTPIP